MMILSAYSWCPFFISSKAKTKTKATNYYKTGNRNGSNHKTGK
jgi:hypothetical protein